MGVPTQPGDLPGSPELRAAQWELSHANNLPGAMQGCRSVPCALAMSAGTGGALPEEDSIDRACVHGSPGLLDLTVTEGGDPGGCLELYSLMAGRMLLAARRFKAGPSPTGAHLLSYFTQEDAEDFPTRSVCPATFLT